MSGANNTSKLCLTKPSISEQFDRASSSESLDCSSDQSLDGSLSLVSNKGKMPSEVS